MPSPYMAVGEVALLLGVSEKWVYNRKKQIPGYFKIGGLIRFDREILVKHLKELALPPKRSRGSYSGKSPHGL